MAKAKQQTPRSSGGTPKATPRPEAEATEPAQLSVLVLQVDALEHDEAVRQELKRAGFVVKQQALVRLSADAARQFVLEVCNPRSAFYQPPAAPTDANSDVEGQPTVGSEAPGHVDEATTVAGGSEALEGPVETEEDREAAENEIQALAKGPALVLGVEKPNAIAELLQLVGPADPHSWEGDGAQQCLRARFAKDAPRQLGLRCSAQERTAEQELAFLLARAGSKALTKAQPQSQSQLAGSNGASYRNSRNAAMGLEQLLSFLFPAHVQHPNSAGRLFVFALYGPLDARSRLRSGEKGLHVVTDGELTAMSARMEREDILAVYGMCSLSQEEEEEVVRQVDHLLKRFPQYSPRDVSALFASLPRDAQGCMNFHDMQRVVQAERLRRVLCMKERLHPALAPPVRNRFARTLTRASAKAETLRAGAPSSFFLQDVGATNVENAALVSRLLSTRAFQICQMEDGNAPALTQNVRLLRDDRARQPPERDPWNPNCQKASQQQQQRK